MTYGTDNPRDGRVTGRGIVLGALAALAIGLGCAYAVFVLRGSYMDLDFSTPGAVFLIFILVAGPNLLLRRFARRWALTQTELLTVYIMMVVASAIPTMGLTGQLLPLSTAPYYYATPENRWEEIIIENMPPWVSPRGSDVGAAVIREFFEGGGPGTPVPWHAWLPALAAWLPFLLCLHFVMICMMVLLRRQWVEREKLAYPLVQLPIELTRTDEPRAANALLRDPVMWGGFALPFFVGGLIGLHFYFPSVPRPRLDFSISTFRHTSSLLFRLSFPMIGFFYLVSTETTLSLWVFNLLFFVTRGILDILGIGLQETLGPFGAVSPTFKHLGLGAMIALVATGLWVAREHLRRVWLAAVGRASPDEDAGEILPYRAAFWGTVLGLIFMGVWLSYSGMSWFVAIYFLVLAFILFIGLTRIVAESGMAEAVAAAIAPPMVVSELGARTVGARGIIGLALTYTWCSDIRTYVMASAANSLKIVERIRHGKRRIFWAMLLAIVVAIASSMFITLKWGYEEGGLTMNNWFFRGGPMGCYSWAAHAIVTRPGTNWAGVGLVAVGAVTMVILAIARQRLLWWPFHPIGFAIGGTWIMDQLWLTCFIAWLLKAAILHYGGLKIYQRLRPAFLGLILGQFTCNGFWLIVDHFTGRTGNQIFWI